MKLKYTLIKQIAPNTEVKVDDFYNYFKNEVIFENDVEKELWNKLTNQEEILKSWFQLDMTRNETFQKACVEAKLNETILFNLNEDIQKMSDRERLETFEYLKSLKFKPEQEPTTIIKK